MRELLIIETRDAADHKDPERMADLAIGMSKTGVPTTIFLAENGAFNARANAKSRFEAAISKGVQIAVDRFALDERAIDEAALVKGVSVETIELVVDRLADGACVVWR